MCVIRDRLGDRYYGRCVVILGDPPTPFGVGGLNSIALALLAFAGTSSIGLLAIREIAMLWPKNVMCFQQN